MKKMKLYLLCLAVVVIIIPMSTALAITLSTELSTEDASVTPQSSNTDSPPAADITAQQALIREKKAALTAERCAIVEEKVQLQITRFESNLGRRHAFFQRFANRLEKLITKLKASGYDTTKLEADLVILREKITKYYNDKTAYIVLLKQSRLYTCGKSEGEFRSKLLEAKEALNTARLSNLDVKNYYQTVIRPDIKALKNQIKTSKTQADQSAGD
ncbi:MAG: hypothetical protein Q7S37_00960 [bacterium]|nr:hypothetical protein [bacterium]